MIVFVIKLFVFLLYCWMVNVYIEVYLVVVMFYVGVLLKIGVYGIICFGKGLFLEYFYDVVILIVILGVINLLYGVFLVFI